MIFREKFLEEIHMDVPPQLPTLHDIVDGEPLPLPHYPDEKLRELTARDLVHLMALNEDRVPRNVIEECARRGSDAVTELADALEVRLLHHCRDTTGVWWLPLHAVQVLGLMSTPLAGEMLVRRMRAMHQLHQSSPDFELQDELCHFWPAFFANKPSEIIRPMQALLADERNDADFRLHVMEVLLATAANEGAEALDRELDVAARLLTAPGLSDDFRMLVAMLLINFPRDRYRAPLEHLLRRFWVPPEFMANQLALIYRRGTDHPPWHHFGNPLVFYEEEQMRDRHEMRRGFVEQPDFHATSQPMPAFVAPRTEVGRNDACPCGSGKKHKKCCLGKAH
jgi:hypothetical protein